MKELEAHWGATKECRMELSSLRGLLSLSQEDVLAALGGIERLSEYEGSFEEAKADIRTYAEQTLSTFLDKLQVMDEPTHNEAKVIAFTEVYTASGRKIHVTAREGATPEDIAVTTLSLVRAIQILERAGIKK